MRQYLEALRTSASSSNRIDDGGHRGQDSCVGWEPRYRPVLEKHRSNIILSFVSNFIVVSGGDCPCEIQHINDDVVAKQFTEIAASEYLELFTC